MIKGWSFAKIITLPIPDANLTGFPVEVPIVADADIGAECLASGYDIRFTADDGITLLSYERESFAVASGEATGIFWVKTSVATAGTYIWCYYGNAAATDGENAEAVWDDDFAAVYHLKDATTSTTLDSTQYDNDGTKGSAGAPAEGVAKIGNGQVFGGQASGHYIDCGITASIRNARSELTLEAWTKAVDIGGWASVMASRGTAIWDFGLLGSGWGNKTFFLSIGGTEYTRVFSDFVYNEWCHVVATFNDAANTIDWYFNGTPLAQTTGVATVIPDSADNFFVGKRPDIFYFNGTLDETRISSIVRSADWIAYEYANMNPADGGLTWGAEKNVKSAVHSFFES
jgi:hypothetical protein